MKNIISIALIFIASFPLYAEECLPKGMLITAYSEGNWQLYLPDGKCGWNKVSTESEPRTPSLSVSNNSVAYVDAAGNVREKKLESLEDLIIIEKSGLDAYTQLSYDASGNNLYAVLLKDGNSVDSDIVLWNRKNREISTVLSQRSAQFEPFPSKDGNVYYGNVSCTVQCKQVIQEIWELNETGATVKQLTLLNATSRQPVSDGNGNIYFSSNKHHFFNIWKYSQKHKRSEKLTEGTVVDFSPVVISSKVYFIRKTPDDISLMVLNTENKNAKPVTIKSQFEDIKELRLGRTE